jgi:hypothetical protein
MRIAKTTTKQETQEKQEYEVRDIRVREVAPGEVELVEIVLRGAPVRVRTLARGARSAVQVDARLWEEYRLGPDRYGDSGLGPRWNGDLQRPYYE